jgi:hypothetical protein
MYQIEQGQVYEESRNGGIYKVVYVNKDVVLLQYNVDSHRVEERDYFESCIDEGYFDPQEVVPEIDEQEVSESDENASEEISHEEIDWLGEKGEDSLRRAGLSTASDIERVSNDRLLQCNSVGETAVENIRDWVEENV